MTGRLTISGNHGEVEMVVVNWPRPCFHASGITRCASNPDFSARNEPATLSLRTIVGACTGSVIATTSDILAFEFETAWNRIFAGRRSASVTFALKRNTVGASRRDDWVTASAATSFSCAYVKQRAVIHVHA